MKCLNALSGYKNLNVNVLIGKLNKNYKKIKQKFKSSRNFKFFYNIPNKKVYSIINNSNISIGSGGINMLERLFLGIPSIVICTAENQKDSIENLVKKKFIIFYRTNMETGFYLIHHLKKIVISYGSCHMFCSS